MAHEKSIKPGDQPQLSSAEFLASYNQHIPIGFPRLTDELLKKFQNDNPLLFKDSNFWTLDEHRKKVVDWFQLL